MNESQNIYFSHIAGTINADEKDRMKRLLFRATRGKALTYFSDYEQKQGPGEKPNLKSVYIVIF